MISSENYNFNPGKVTTALEWKLLFTFINCYLESFDYEYLC